MFLDIPENGRRSWLQRASRRSHDPSTASELEKSTMSSDELSIYREGPMNVERDESHIADVGRRDTPDRPRSKGYRLTLSFIAVAF